MMQTQKKTIQTELKYFRYDFFNNEETMTDKEKSRFHNQKGVTLIELLIVLMILGVLAALVGPKMFKQTWKAKQKAAKDQIVLFETALDLYKLEVGKYPSQENGLKALVEQPAGEEKWDGPYLKKGVPRDPWGNPYVYVYPGKHGDYDIISLGADNSQGGEGENLDIVSWLNVGESES